MVRRLQPGRIGEIQAEQWFINNGWYMVRTQPAIQILGIKPGAWYGRIFMVRMVGRGGVPDYTGYKMAIPYDGFFVGEPLDTRPIYRACEVKEAAGDTMPASRLDKAQRQFMADLPAGSAWVGIYWTDHGKYSMHKFIDRGSYAYGR